MKETEIGAGDSRARARAPVALAPGNATAATVLSTDAMGGAAGEPPRRKEERETKKTTTAEISRAWEVLPTAEQKAKQRSKTDSRSNR